MLVVWMLMLSSPGPQPRSRVIEMVRQVATEAECDAAAMALRQPRRRGVRAWCYAEPVHPATFPNAEMSASAK